MVPFCGKSMDVLVPETVSFSTSRNGISSGIVLLVLLACGTRAVLISVSFATITTVPFLDSVELSETDETFSPKTGTYR